MKLILGVLATIVICSYSDLSAQPQGGRSPRGGQREEGRPPRDGGDYTNRDKDVSIFNFPEIPDITLKQRLKLTDIVSKEQKNISSLRTNKIKLEMEINDNPDISTKDLRKKQDKMSEIDEKMTKVEFDNDKKIKKLLTVDQYQFFKEKKKEIVFKRPPGKKGDGQMNKSRPQTPQKDKANDEMLDELFN